MPTLSNVTFDGRRETASYFCLCGRNVTVDFSDIRLESLDYCSCGRLRIQLVKDAEVLAGYRKLAGVPVSY